MLPECELAVSTFVVHLAVQDIGVLTLLDARLPRLAPLNGPKL
jgi:hypothetical protein